MIYLLAIIFILSLGLTGFLRRYALAKNIMDIPNQRSSHVVPTPRGGGVAFIIAVLMAFPFVWYLGFEVVSIGTALVSAGLFVAVLGFFDDRNPLPAYFRLLGHFSASMIALYWLDGMPSIDFLGWTIPVSWGLNTLAVLYLVWLLNLYNFMDGINGIAAIEAISVCLGGACIYWLNTDNTLLGLPLVLAAAVAGFLWWNFPSARIFMGDSGSNFLGLALGILSIQAAGIKSQFFWAWLILLAVFIVDATVTLLFRLFKGRKVYQAHCDHAYQHAAQYFGSHSVVTISVLLINIIWLLPIAILVSKMSISGTLGLVIAYFPLLILAIGFRAGR